MTRNKNGLAAELPKNAKQICKMSYQDPFHKILVSCLRLFFWGRAATSTLSLPKDATARDTQGTFYGRWIRSKSQFIQFCSLKKEGGRNLLIMLPCRVATTTIEVFSCMLKGWVFSSLFHHSSCYTVILVAFDRMVQKLLCIITFLSF